MVGGCPRSLVPELDRSAKGRRPGDGAESRFGFGSGLGGEEDMVVYEVLQVGVKTCPRYKYEKGVTSGARPKSAETTNVAILTD